MSEKIRCGNCKFWQLMYEFRDSTSTACLREHKDDYKGVCRRYPPQIDSVFANEWSNGNGFGAGAESSDNCWRQPITTACELCGEHLSD